MASTINASSSGAGGLISTGDSSGVLQLQSNTSPTVTIDASGNVGIGTTSPGGSSTDRQLTVTGSTSAQLTTNSGTVSTNFGSTSSVGYIQIPGAYPMVFQTSNTERMRIDSSGNVLIGKTSQHLGEALNITRSGESYIDCYSTTSGISVLTGTDPTGSTGFNGTYSNHPYVFRTNNTERMRIDSSGNVGIGTNSPSATLQVAGTFTYFTTSSTSNASLTLRKGVVGADTIDYFQCRDSSNNLKFDALANGGLGNYSANNQNYSDERLKTDINLSGSYLDKICAIPVKTFLYKDQTDTELNLGVIAQDVQKVAPELISTNGDMGVAEDNTPYLTVYQTDLQYALMKSIQELKAIVDAQQQEINALKGAK